MKNCSVYNDLVDLVMQRANPRQSENLSFSEALRKVRTGTQVKAETRGKEAANPHG